MPMELIEKIIDFAANDKSLPQVRLVCGLFESLSERHFHRAYLTHLHIDPTHEAFTRLLWTVQDPVLSDSVQSITVLYDNDDFSESGALCFGMYEEGNVDRLLRALDHFHRRGRTIDLNVKITKVPLDPTDSVISILYRVLVYVLFGHGLRGLRSISLDIDDTSSAALPILTNPSQDGRYWAEEFGPRFERIWAHIRGLDDFKSIQVRFTKKGEKTDALRALTIAPKNRGISVSLQNLTIWHLEIMGRTNIFSEIHYLDIKNCALDSCPYRDFFNNSKLRELFLQDVSLYSIFRRYNPVSAYIEEEAWDETLPYIAEVTELQSFSATRLIDFSGHVHYRQLWGIKTTSQRSVSEVIHEYWG